MRLDHAVNVPADVKEVWSFLDDTNAVVACMPGAELTETLDRDNHRGQVKLSIGPLSMNYHGDVTVVSRDEVNHRMLLRAAGRDRRGSGTAKATIDLALTPEDAQTRLSVVTDVQLTGRIASLGRGVQDVSNKLFSEFATQLATELDPQRQPQQASAATGEESGVGSGPTHAGTGAAAPVPSGVGQPGADTSIKIAPLVWSVTRQRLADFLQRLSERVRPHQ